jgi:hypothetical protein
MHSFSQRLDTQQGFLSFYFNELTTSPCVRYHISVVGKGNKLYTVNMEKEADHWVLVNPINCPDWIVALEKTLDRVIQDHMREGAN